jgi:hypothetical protein
MTVTFDDIVAMTADLPMVGVGTSYGTPAVQVKGKSFCRMWDDNRYVEAGIDDTEVLVVMGELEMKLELMELHGPVVLRPTTTPVTALSSFDSPTSTPRLWPTGWRRPIASERRRRR